jgi:hypothetical protein
MTEVKIAAIVEGHGECEAVPVLIRRIAREISPGFVPQILLPFRIPASRLVKEDELERTIAFVAKKLQGEGGIVVIVDCDEGCPAEEGPALLKRATAVRKDIPISIILAKREYEAWFLAAAVSLRGKRGLPDDLNPPADPESVRGAKEWLSDRMPSGMCYKATTDQPALTDLFDMQAARAAGSFDKCYRDIKQMLENLYKINYPKNS